MGEPFPWSDAFAVGNESLDAEHRRMVGLINDICINADEGRNSELSSLLGKLQFVSETHFRNEEIVLAQIASEIDHQHLQTVVRIAIEQHTREHRRRLDELQKKSITRSDTLKLGEELKAWFVNHAIGCEAKVKAILQSTHHIGEAVR